MSPGSHSDVRIDKPVLFVVGSGRSGTTLLYELLCSQPAAAWFSNYSQRLPWLGRFHPRVPTSYKGARRRWAARPVEGYRLYDAVRPPGPTPGSDGELTAADLSAGERTALRRAVAAHLAPARVRFFVNKNTRNTRRAGYLAAAFPEARFVHIVRHPVAAAASLSKVAFFPELAAFWRDGRSVADLVSAGVEPLQLAAELWALETASCRRALDGLPEDRRLELRYEDLVEHPVDRVEEVLALVGQPVSSSVRAQIAARDIGSRNDRAFREMPSHLQRAVWQVAGDEAARYGYEPQ